MPAIGILIRLSALRIPSFLHPFCIDHDFYMSQVSGKSACLLTFAQVRSSRSRFSQRGFRCTHCIAAEQKPEGRIRPQGGLYQRLPGAQRVAGLVPAVGLRCLAVPSGQHIVVRDGNTAASSRLP